jgi:hypothetical protein
MSTAKQRHPLVLFWIYTSLRVLIFVVLFGLLWLFGLRGLVGAAIALVLSVPLSYVLLGRQRRAMAGELHDRMMSRQAKTDAFDAELSGGVIPSDED